MKINLPLRFGYFAVFTLLFFSTSQGSTEEIFSIFGATSGADPVTIAPSNQSESELGLVPRRTRSSRAEDAPAGAYCVRTCDGRYFPAPPGDRFSQAEACRNFCPATETKAFYGTPIERASSKEGKSYSQLPNAYRYRTELVPNCSCNGKGPVGLASLTIEQDKTVRPGDLIAGEDTLLIATRGASDSSPAFSESLASMKRFSRSFARN